MAFKPINSVQLNLQIWSATLVVAPDETHLVFPAIDVEHGRPPTKRLNTNPDGPSVVRVDVHQIPGEQARREFLGRTGDERLTLFLPPDQFSDLLQRVEGLRRPSGGDAAVTIALDVNVAADGIVDRALVDGEPIVISVSSRTIGLENDPASGTGVGRR